MDKEKGLLTLREITAFLEQHGVRFAPVTREIADKLATGGELAADDRLALFGGMGSLSDARRYKTALPRAGRTTSQRGAIGRPPSGPAASLVVIHSMRGA